MNHLDVTTEHQRPTANPREPSSSPAWEEFKREELVPGFCVAGCETRIAPPKRFLCGSKECKRLFHAVYRRGLRHKALQLAGAPIRERDGLH